MANLASSIKNKEHLKVFDDLMSERFADIDLSALITNLFDTVSEVYLPALAKQYNLLGYNGWRFADTEAKKRALLKDFINIKRSKGTIAGVKTALKWIEFEPIEYRIDPYDLYCDGKFECNGHFTCGGNNPFNFEVSISANDFPTVTEQNVIDMVAIIKEFKSARDLLIGINLKDVNENEGLTISDELTINEDDGVTVTTHVL